MALLEVRQPQRYMDDLILDAPIRAAVDRLVREFREWDVLEANGLTPIRRVIFCGPSGCGKISSLLGETAANLRKVFDYAKRGHDCSPSE